MAKAIEAEGLTKVYGPSIRAVDGVSFQVEEGEIFGFLGPNGAGKTTTIKMLTTLATVTEGKSRVMGYDVAKDPDKVRRAIGLTPQEAAVDGDLTGTENLLLSAGLYGVDEAEARKRANELLELVSLQEAARRLVRTYSGGMKKRLELVAGLIHEPSVLFLDEPTLGLDIQTRIKMWEYIRGINKERGMTIFLTTHYIEEADALCDRVAIIDHGRIKVVGSPAELKASLGGDLLELVLPDGPDMSDAIAAMNGGLKVARNGNVYSIRVPHVEDSLQKVSVELWKLGVSIESVRVEKSSLDQVFLDVTGRSIRDEGAGK